MVNRADFDAFYTRELQPLIAQTEAERRSVEKWSYIRIGAFLLAAVVIAILFSAGVEGAGAFLPIILPIIIVFIYEDKKKAFRLRFKKTIVSRIVQFVNPGCVYEPQSFIHESEYTASQLYRKDTDRYNGEDYFEGKYNKTAFFCSELHTEYKTTNSKGQSSWHTIFRGLFYVADFNKHFNGGTYVWNNNTREVSTTMLGRLFSTFSSTVERVHLESPEFEDLFDVYSTDQVEARYILSPSLMERLVNLHAHTGFPIRCSFVNSKMYLAFDTDTNLFEPGIYATNETANAAWKYVTEFSLFFEIIDELNLNTRIWTKQ